MDLLEIHNRFELLVNKTTGQYFSHEEIDQLLDTAQMQEFELLIENSRELPQPRVGYGRSQKIAEDLTPFLESTILSSPSTGNVFGLPSNLEYLTQLMYGNKEVFFVSETEIPDILDSEIIAPTASYPVAHFHRTNAGGQKLIKVYPSTISSITAYYLKRPPEPNFAYSTSGRVITYNQSGSTQMTWKDGAITRIIHRALALAGIRLGDPALYQTNEEKQRTGQ